MNLEKKRQKVRTQVSKNWNLCVGSYAFVAEQKLIHSSIFILDYLLVWCFHLKVKIFGRKKSGINIQQKLWITRKIELDVKNFWRWRYVCVSECFHHFSYSIFKMYRDSARAAAAALPSSDVVCVRFSRVQTQATAMVARQIRFDVCVRRVEHRQRRRYYAENRDGHFSFRAVFFFVRSVVFTSNFAAFLLFRFPESIFSLWFTANFMRFDLIIIHYSYSLRAIRHETTHTRHTTHLHWDFRSRSLVGRHKFIDSIIRTECLLGVNFFVH